jgi:WD40 repeat protein
MVWSSDGLILATCSSLGSIRLWDTTTWKLIQELRDAEEEKIEEFYTIRFSPDNTKLFAAGKLKHRDRWSNEDDDNQVAPGPIKVHATLRHATPRYLCSSGRSSREAVLV